PRPGGDFREARAALETPYGTLSSAWALEGDTFTWDVTVPANTTATAYVPVSLGLDVREGNVPANTAEGVTATGTADGAALYELGAGTYHFTSRI
ncbi:MAG TPA: alpha-L-rhamnosidase C-terminal domain-containing protein, partial [Roseiflexaceae bacterium]|nr:alpha-L-rhamnosidase C-terminal domain-containing protein [Roseiflexaceae bacterium]